MDILSSLAELKTASGSAEYLSSSLLSSLPLSSLLLFSPLLFSSLLSSLFVSSPGVFHWFCTRMTSPTGLSSMAQHGSICGVKATVEPLCCHSCMTGTRQTECSSPWWPMLLIVSGGLTVMEVHASRAASPGNFAVHKQSITNYWMGHFAITCLTL